MRPEEAARMRLEGQRGRRPIKAARARQGGADDGAVPAMHAVEIADRHDCAIERAIVLTAHDAEGPERLRLAAHGVCSQRALLKATAGGTLPIAGASSAATGSRA